MHTWTYYVTDTLLAKKNEATVTNMCSYAGSCLKLVRCCCCTIMHALEHVVYGFLHEDLQLGLESVSKTRCRRRQRDAIFLASMCKYLTLLHSCSCVSVSNKCVGYVVWFWAINSKFCWSKTFGPQLISPNVYRQIITNRCRINKIRSLTRPGTKKRSRLQAYTSYSNVILSCSS